MSAASRERRLSMLATTAMVRAMVQMRGSAMREKSGRVMRAK